MIAFSRACIALGLLALAGCAERDQPATPHATHASRQTAKPPRSRVAPELSRTHMLALPRDHLLFYRDGWARIRTPDGTWGPELRVPPSIFHVASGPSGLLVAPGFPPEAEASAVLFDGEGLERARVRLSERVRSVSWLDGSPLVLTATGAHELTPDGRLGATHPYPAGTQLPLGPSARHYLFGHPGELVACIGNLLSKDCAAAPVCERAGQGAYRFEADFYEAVACGENLAFLHQDPRELVVRTRALPGLEAVVDLEPPKGRAFDDAVGLAHQLVYRLSGAPNELLFVPLP